MFHSFHVAPEHQNFLRFLWYKDNDPSKEIIENKMTVHLFGNGPSPAIATFGLRKTADDGEEKYGKATRDFIHRNFYMDDGLTSCPTESETISLVRNAQAMLATANPRLHKVVSNSVTVMEALPAEDRAKSVKDLDLRRDILPTQRSLGVHWDIEKDQFTFRVSLLEKPFTHRGVLSIVNSVYDPLGLASPVILEGKLILQQLVPMGKKPNNNGPYCRRIQIPVNGDDVPPYLPEGYYVFHFRKITFNQQQLNEEWRLSWEQPLVPPLPPGWAQFRSNNLYPYTSFFILVLYLASSNTSPPSGTIR